MSNKDTKAICERYQAKKQAAPDISEAVSEILRTGRKHGFNVSYPLDDTARHYRAAFNLRYR